MKDVEWADGLIACSDDNRKGANDMIETLPASFTVDEAWNAASRMRGSTVTRNMVKQMLKNWKRQGLVTNPAIGKYQKMN